MEFSDLKIYLEASTNLQGDSSELVKDGPRPVMASDTLCRHFGMCTAGQRVLLITVGPGPSFLDSGPEGTGAY